MPRYAEYLYSSLFEDTDELTQGGLMFFKSTDESTQFLDRQFQFFFTENEGIFISWES